MSSSEALKKLHDDFVGEFRGSAIGARLWGRFSGRVITAVLSNPALKEAAIGYLESAWDSVVVPYDVPMIPDDLEKELEDWGRAQIRPSVEWALARLAAKGQPSAPNPPAPETEPTVPGFGFGNVGND